MKFSTDLKKWLKSLPAKDRVRESNVAHTNLQRIANFLKK